LRGVSMSVSPLNDHSVWPTPGSAKAQWRWMGHTDAASASV
jgi:hypothetical protein